MINRTRILFCFFLKMSVIKLHLFGLPDYESLLRLRLSGRHKSYPFSVWYPVMSIKSALLWRDVIGPLQSILFFAIPRMLMLCLPVSIATMGAFSCLYVVLIFQAAITVRCFGKRRIARVGIRHVLTGLSPSQKTAGLCLVLHPCF